MLATKVNKRFNLIGGWIERQAPKSNVVYSFISFLGIEAHNEKVTFRFKNREFFMLNLQGEWFRFSSPAS
jgi:hypothetical protein